jgi:hypothetical protein
VDSLRNPVGPHPPSLYWRRRAVALGVVILAVMLLAWGCGLSGGGQDRPASMANVKDLSSRHPAASITPTPGPRTGPVISSVTGGGPGSNNAASPNAAPVAGNGSGAPTPASQPGVAACAPGTVRMTAQADRPDYPAQVRPKFTVIVENQGQNPCALDLGSRAVAWTVTSGEDRIWSSGDCPAVGSPEVLLLAPRQPVLRSVDWSRMRSRPGCPSSVEAAKPGFYKASVAVQGVGSTAYPFKLS